MRHDPRHAPSIRLRQFQPRFLRDGFGRAGDLFPKFPFRAVLPQGSHTRRVGEVPGGPDQRQFPSGAADDAWPHCPTPSVRAAHRCAVSGPWHPSLSPAVPDTAIFSDGSGSAGAWGARAITMIDRGDHSSTGGAI